MAKLQRNLATLADGLVYGPLYAFQQHLIRSTDPLDEKYVWYETNRAYPAAVDWALKNYPPAFARSFVLSAKMKRDHIAGISEHYDISNDFYKLFLDKRHMFYSSADFHSEDDSLEDAQSYKADFLLDLIDPLPGDKILDLGFGWGSMMQRINEVTGVPSNLFGYTISEEQLSYVQNNYDFNVVFKNFITDDYPINQFDKIYSIETWEHVRWHELPMVLEKLFNALKPGGRLVKQFFCLLENGIPTTMIGTQLYFPGSILASYGTHIRLFEAAGFRIRKRSVHDYRPTLRAWYNNLVSEREQAIELVGVQTYNRYLVFLATAHRFFNDNDAMLMRFLLEKPK